MGEFNREYLDAQRDAQKLTQEQYRNLDTVLTYEWESLEAQSFYIGILASKKLPDAKPFMRDWQKAACEKWDNYSTLLIDEAQEREDELAEKAGRIEDGELKVEISDTMRRILTLQVEKAIEPSGPAR